MKKIILSILFIILTFGMTNITTTATTYAAAKTSSPHTTIIEEPDGGYYVKTITEAPASNISTYSTTTKKGTVHYAYYDSNNNLGWKYSLTGTFSVNYGVSATCTGATAGLSIYNSAYSLDSEKHFYFGPTATGTIKIKYFGHVKSATVSITCDKYGKFS